jgi:hypothetical protein
MRSDSRDRFFNDPRSSAITLLRSIEAKRCQTAGVAPE